MPSPKPPAALHASPDDTEQQFYEALQAGDLDRLMAAWSDDDEVLYVHPSGARVIGAAAVRAAFEALFASGMVDVRAEQVKRITTLSSAVHSVLERVTIDTTEGRQTGWVVATNVYVKTAQGWRLVAHHASPGGPGEAVEAPAPGAMLH